MTTGGSVLLGATALAPVWAHVFGVGDECFRDTPMLFRVGELPMALDLRQ